VVVKEKLINVVVGNLKSLYSWLVMMKFKLKIQQYQTDAVENTVSVFKGQPSHSPATYRRDLGRYKQGRFHIP
jgi:hypothetical protein